jgi:hypothetical protein
MVFDNATYGIRVRPKLLSDLLNLMETAGVKEIQDFDHSGSEDDRRA